MSQSNYLSMATSFRAVLALSCILRIGLILYSEWHDAHSLVKYTDVDYRVFSDATHFLLNPGSGNRAQGPLGTWLNVGDPYTRATYRYTPLLSLLLAPNEWIHPSFGKYIFAGCDILAGVLIHSLLLSLGSQRVSSNPARKTGGPKAETRREDPLEDRRAYSTILAAVHLLSPFVFSISTRGSSESVLLLFVLGTLACALRGRWHAASALLGVAVHWKIYPVIYGVACIAAICQERAHAKGKTSPGAVIAQLWSRQAISFAVISAGTFFALGVAMFAIWGRPFLEETYLYHLHRRDHRHNFAPHFYLIYLTYPDGSGAVEAGAGGSRTWWRALLRSPLAGFVPQMVLAIGAGALLARRREDLVLAWFVQTAVFVIFNKVCTSQYFLWYLLFIPLLVPRLGISARRAVVCATVWAATQALWLSQAYRLEFLGEEVFAELWMCGLVYLLGHAWVLGAIIDVYDVTACKQQ
ncbi:glycosyltransferase family 50 protein [Vararia minispora EC-137]|uniref:Glycosyltransferase family 50 protein n=1 Tax=Vararia minispora EC-137 TaxID=1314806 RepID=A0ACB8QJ24_9AGAM|nr:glycosyltransferase family 50 protein [Vararia minispora EC-137]